MTEAKDINHALLLLQADPPLLTKQKKGQVGNQITKYADLPAVNAQVLTRLNALGCVWTCSPTLLPDSAAGPGRFVLQYELLHVASGTSKSGDYPLGAGEPQKMGSAQTYARRYALLAVTGIAAEDEDEDATAATAAQRRPSRAKAEAKPKSETTPAQRATRPDPALPGEETVKPTGPTNPMMTKMAVQFGELGIADRSDRLALIQDMVGRPVASAKELTYEEARGAIDAIEKALKTDNPLTEMIDIYHRTSGSPETAEPVRDRPETSGRQPGQRSRNAAEAIGNGGDEGTEPAPWEGALPV